MLPNGARSPLYRDWIFELTADNWSICHWPRGTLFCLHYNVQPRPGDLVLALINDQLLMARLFPGESGSSWLIEPGRAIEIVTRSLVAILGTLTPLVPLADPVEEGLQRARFFHGAPNQITEAGKERLRLMVEQDATQFNRGRQSQCRPVHAVRSSA